MERKAKCRRPGDSIGANRLRGQVYTHLSRVSSVVYIEKMDWKQNRNKQHCKLLPTLFTWLLAPSSCIMSQETCCVSCLPHQGLKLRFQMQRGTNSSNYYLGCCHARGHVIAHVGISCTSCIDPIKLRTHKWITLSRQFAARLALTSSPRSSLGVCFRPPAFE